jgi:hypothetical protein
LLEVLEVQVPRGVRYQEVV